MKTPTETPSPQHSLAATSGAVTFSSPSSTAAPEFVGPAPVGPVEFSAPTSTAGRSTFTVYAMLPNAPDDDRVYFGMSTMALADRLQLHMNSCRRGPDSRLRQWLDQERAAGTRPIITATTFATEDEAIESFRAAGFDVVNLAKGGGGRRPRAWTEYEDARLGRGPDRAVAESLGIPIWTVRRRRRALGIPSYRSCRGATPASPGSGPAGS